MVSNLCAVAIQRRGQTQTNSKGAGTEERRDHCALDMRRVVRSPQSSICGKEQASLTAHSKTASASCAYLLRRQRCQTFQTLKKIFLKIRSPPGPSFHQTRGKTCSSSSLLTSSPMQSPQSPAHCIKEGINGRCNSGV